MRRLLFPLAAVALAASLTSPVPAEENSAISAYRHATIYPITGPVIEDGVLIVEGADIKAVGREGEVEIPAGAREVDAKGKSILPGLIDAHSHMGVYSWPSVDANDDGNEATAPVTAQVRAEDSINLQDPGFGLARAGGVTTVMILPGSANLIGGEGVVVKLRPDALLADMKFAGAPRQIKMAMGENPKRTYGGKGEIPSTRMGIMAKLREVFTKAQEYRDTQKRFDEKQQKYGEKLSAWREKVAAGKDADEPEEPTPPPADPLSQTLVDVMEGRVRVQVHCYRKDDILDIIRISDEFGFKITALHHVLEGYKVPEELAKRQIGACTWPDWWGFKMEAFDAVPQNMAIMANAGVTVALHSDSADIVQRFPHEAAKAVKYGMTPEQALASITINPARILGVDAWVGSLEPGKDADFIVMSGPPLDMRSLVVKTYVDGKEVFDRATFDGKVNMSQYIRPLPAAYRSQKP